MRKGIGWGLMELASKEGREMWIGGWVRAQTPGHPTPLVPACFQPPPTSHLPPTAPPRPGSGSSRCHFRCFRMPWFPHALNVPETIFKIPLFR